MWEKIRRATIEGKLFEKIYLKIKRRVVDCFNGKNRKKLFKKIDTFIAKRSIRKMAAGEKVENDKILLMATRGGYNCNPRAIADEIIRQKLPWKLVWVARAENYKRLDQFPKQLQLVKRGSYDFYREAARAKVWIDNSVSLSYLNTWKKPEQVLIETWHGSLGIKRLETSTDKMWIKKATESGKRTDYCISNSTFETDLFRSTFWKDTEILEYGHARNDILLTEDAKRAKNVADRARRECGVPPENKVALYAPTYRDGNGFSQYALDYEAVREALAERFGGEWTILVRFHFNLRKLIKKKKIIFPEFVIDVTDYPDIQDLMLITDAAFTDYSSWICDYMLTRKPGFLFALDYRQYYTERGFYYPLETMPFPLAMNNYDLVDNILTFDEAGYREKCDAFIADKGCVEDGHAAERVVEKLKEIMGTET